jgi:signal transduction histidine kinase
LKKEIHIKSSFFDIKLFSVFKVDVDKDEDQDSEDEAIADLKNKKFSL